MRKQALLSVSDKTGVVDFARELSALGYHLLSTGGTAKLIAEAGIEVQEVADYTGFPEMLDGRVKTLNPKIHAGLLARRPVPEHMKALADHGIDPIDIVVVNLYPFEATVAKPDCTFEDAVENIDIGGPTMIRAAAKNHESVAVVVDPADYGRIVEELKAHGEVTPATRLALAKKVFCHTARYDAMISNYLTSLDDEGTKHQFPDTFTRQFDNNIADSDAAWEAVRQFDEPACVIIKHANPCGVAVGVDSAEAYAKAFKTDSKSAFGGILAFNSPVTGACAEMIAKQFAEVIMAPSFTEEALAVLTKKPNLRLLTIEMGTATNDFDFKRVGGGLLVQTPDLQVVSADALRVVTEKAPTAEELKDMLFAWKVAKFVKSNTIVFAKDGMTMGVGAGQMSRVDSARIASIKAEEAGLSLQGTAVASDAFFPFRDGLDVVVDAGATCVIQPGGSVRDEEVIAAANERGIAMVFTGERHFRH